MTGRKYRRIWPRAATNATIREAEGFHFARLVDIAAIDEYRMVHGVLDLVHIERLKLVPFGHNHQGIRALSNFISIFAENDGFHAHVFAFERFTPGVCSHRILHTYPSSLVCYPADDVDRASFSHIVCIGLEG